jgi:DNA gyrase subunit A
MPDDELVSARISDGTMDVFLGSQKGKSIRFHEKDVRLMGRVSRGVRGLKVGNGDRIVSMEVLSHGQTLFAVTENGYGKRTLIDEYPVRKRGGKGVISIKTTVRNGDVAAILLVEEEDDLMLMTDSGKLIRMPIRSISVISRNTQGVKLIGLEGKEKVIGAARLAEADEVDDSIPVAVIDQSSLEPEDDDDDFIDSDDDIDEDSDDSDEDADEDVDESDDGDD